MFKKQTSPAPKRKKTLKSQITTTAVLCAGMVGLYVLGKREDAKIKRAFEDFQGQ